MNPRPVVSLDHLPAVLTLEEYADVMRAGVRTVRRQLAAGTCLVPPRLVQPYRWMRADVEAYLSSTSLPDERRRLMRVAAASVLVLALASSALAQTVGPVVDKAAIGLPDGWVFWPQEFDGDVTTREWIGLLYDAATDQVLHRVVAERGGRFCVGAVFNPVDVLRPIREFSALAWVRLQGVDALVLQGLRYYQEFRFVVPSC